MDKEFVKSLNQVFYDVEAKIYDDRHPEVLEGNQVWWNQLGETLARSFKNNEDIKFLDVGCGTGYVGDIIAPYLRTDDSLTFFDLSLSMLQEARKKILRHKCRTNIVCGEVDFLPFKSNSYDVVAINALLHHLSDIGPLLRETDRILRKGGYVIVAHEPNRLFFSSILLRFAASLYKVLGQGKSITDEMQTEINKRLKSKNLIDVDLSKEYILKMVEYNSPVEQAKYAVPKDKGLIPSEIIDSFFSGYKLIQIREYTTFFIRPIFHRLKWLGKSVEFLSVLLLRKGNLFSFICQK